MDLRVGSESHMLIRRGRLTSGNRYSSVSYSSDPRNTNVYERLLRRKSSFERSSITGSFRRNDLSSSDNDYIERRRKRFQDIQKDIPETSYKEKVKDVKDVESKLQSDTTNNNDQSEKKEISQISKKQDHLSDRKVSGEVFEDSPKTKEQWKSETTFSILPSKSLSTSSPKNSTDTSEVDAFIANIADETVKTTSRKNTLTLSLNISEGQQEDPEMDVKMSKRKPLLTSSEKIPQSSTQIRKESCSNPRRTSAQNETLPDLPDTPRTPSNSADRLKRDYGLTDLEIVALRGILKKADLYEESVRERMLQVLKMQDDSTESIESITNNLMKEKEIESMKQKLFMSRKELDSYISFMKKMEREKRQSMSEKEELETKIQWHERRLTRFETENKSLKKEKADLLNQVYELRGKSLSKDNNWRNQSERSSSGVPQPELEQSKQRLIYEADAFAQEKTKLIKERQRLDEEVRKVQIRCVSLLAQLQHSEKTIQELKDDKETLKLRFNVQIKECNQEICELKKQLAETELSVIDKNKNLVHKKEHSAIVNKIKEEDRRMTIMVSKYDTLEEEFENLKNDFRKIDEEKITLAHENMALKDTINVIQKAKEDIDLNFNELDAKYHEVSSELKNSNCSIEQYQIERIQMQNELENLSSRLSELQHDAINMEDDQDAFKKFLDKLSMELQEKLGEEHVSKDKQGESLQEQAEIIGREIIAHLNPCRKLQEDFEAIKQDRDDLEEEIRYLKFALSARLEIQNMQVNPAKCECSKEKENIKQELEESCKKIDALEDEVDRLHQDKQQLLMSFLNLQASQRLSKCDMDQASDEECTDDEEDLDKSGDNRKNSSGDEFESSSNVNDLQARLNEVIKAKERLESERIEMLGSLCKQVEVNEALKAEMEELKQTNTPQPNSRPGSSLSKSGSSTTLSSEKCPKCEQTSDEIRSYLSIIEELTEDKLRLEKHNSDLEAEKDAFQCDLERITDMKSHLELELQQAGVMKESALKASKHETNFLVQNIQTLEQENQVLQENLRKLREDKSEILDNLRQAEEDRFGFIRTISLITEQKENSEKEVESLQAKIQSMKLSSR